MSYVRNLPIGYERIKAAAEIIYRKTNDPIALTISNIAALESESWEGKNTIRMCSRTLSGEFYKQRRRREKKSGIRLNNVYLLRETIGAYGGNLEEATETWGKFETSASDLLRSVRLPLELKYEESRFLGNCWSDGCISKRFYGSYTFGLSGRKEDFDFYRNYVVTDIKNIFNINTKVTEKKDVHTLGEKEVGFKYPVINVGSKAIITWLAYDLGFPTGKNKRNVELPKARIIDEKGFFDGIAEAMGSPGPNNGTIRILDKVATFIYNLQKLAESFGLHPSKHKPIKSEVFGTYGEVSNLYLSKEDVKSLDIRNPRLLESL